MFKLYNNNFDFSTFNFNSFFSNVDSSLSKNQKVLVEGRLQNGISKMDDGTEKRVFEIEAATIELMGGASTGSNSSNDEGDILTFGDMESSSPDANTDVLMDDEEVPF